MGSAAGAQKGLGGVSGGDVRGSDPEPLHRGGGGGCVGVTGAAASGETAGVGQDESPWPPLRLSHQSFPGGCFAGVVGGVPYQGSGVAWPGVSGATGDWNQGLAVLPAGALAAGTGCVGVLAVGFGGGGWYGGRTRCGVTGSGILRRAGVSGFADCTGATAAVCSTVGIGRMPALSMGLPCGCAGPCGGACGGFETTGSAGPLCGGDTLCGAGQPAIAAAAAARAAPSVLPPAAPAGMLPPRSPPTADPSGKDPSG